MTGIQPVLYRRKYYNGFEHQLLAGSREIRETAQLSSRVLRDTAIIIYFYTPGQG